MCGRYSLRRFDFPSDQAYRAAKRGDFEEFSEKPRFNVAPSQRLPIVRLDRDGDRVISLARWGLIPSWTTGKPKVQPINAKARSPS